MLTNFASKPERTSVTQLPDRQLMITLNDDIRRVESTSSETVSELWEADQFTLVIPALPGIENHIEDNFEAWLDKVKDPIRKAKIAEISKACNTTIVAGVDVSLQGRIDHFNLALEDQSNINNLFRVVELGGTEFPYQADDGTCLVYTAKEIAQIYIAAQTLITTQTAYHNALKMYVNFLEKAEDIVAVQYGMELPDPYKTELAGKLAVAKKQMDAIMKNLESAA